jgi:hypothetical protein
MSDKTSFADDRVSQILRPSEDPEEFPKLRDCQLCSCISRWASHRLVSGVSLSDGTRGGASRTRYNLVRDPRFPLSVSPF